MMNCNHNYLHKKYLNKLYNSLLREYNFNSVRKEIKYINRNHRGEIDILINDFIVNNGKYEPCVMYIEVKHTRSKSSKKHARQQLNKWRRFCKTDDEMHGIIYFGDENVFEKIF